MAVETSISDSGKYLVCRVTEPITEDVVLQMVEQLGALAEQTGINCRLLDVRGMPNTMSVVAKYDLAYEGMEEMQIERSTKVASLMLPSDVSHEFVNNAIKNAGFNLRTFTNEAAAIAWLESGE